MGSVELEAGRRLALTAQVRFLFACNGAAPAASALDDPRLVARSKRPRRATKAIRLDKGPPALGRCQIKLISVRSIELEFCI